MLPVFTSVDTLTVDHTWNRTVIFSIHSVLRKDSLPNFRNKVSVK